MTVSQIGLVFDIAGAVMLFVFGVPKEPFWRATEPVVVSKPNGNSRKERVYEWLYKAAEYLGLALLLIGFGLQLAGSVEHLY